MIHCDCGETTSGVCAICGTEAVEWAPISNPGQMKSGGHYYLTDDVSATATGGANWRLTGQYHLDLNGHTITREGTVRLFDTYGGNANTLLVITDSSDKPGKLVGIKEDKSNPGTDQGMIFWLPVGQLRVYNVTLDTRGVDVSHFGTVLSTNGANADVATSAAFYNVRLPGL